MRRSGCVTAAATIAAAVFFAPPSHAATVATVEGVGGQPGSLNSELGSICELPNVCQGIVYNTAFPDPVYSGGVAALDYWITNTTGDKVVVGYSLGGAVITTWAVANPVAADLSLFTFGNPYVGRIPGTVSYPVTEVVYQYDPVADPPDAWWNLLAVLNAWMSSAHTSYSPADLTDPDAVRWVDGNVTYVLIPADVLPLVAWMDPASAAQWTTALQPYIESAYNRPPVLAAPPVAQEVTQWDGSTTTGTATTVASLSQPTVASSPTAVSPQSATQPQRVPATEPASAPVATKKPKVRASVKAEPGRVGGNDVTHSTKPSSGAAPPSASRDQDTPKAERKAERQAEKADKRDAK